MSVEELRKLKFSALERMAHERGIAASAITEAIDADWKAALVALLAPAGGSGAGAGAGERPIPRERRRASVVVTELELDHIAPMLDPLARGPRRQRVVVVELDAATNERAGHCCHINSVPPNVLHHILLTATTHGDGAVDNLLHFVATCARVCAEWRRVVGGSVAYGRALGAERARVLKVIARELDGQKLNFNHAGIGGVGGVVLGAALAAMPSPLPYEAINLRHNGLAAAALAPIAAAIGGGRVPHLKVMCVDGNQLGDEGAKALARALADCATLAHLTFDSNGVGAAGFEAVAAQVPRWPRLRVLNAMMNPGPLDALGRALAAALPMMPDAISFFFGESGLSEEVAVELRAAKAATGSRVGLYMQGTVAPLLGARSVPF